jgi:hypothetical protein
MALLWAIYDDESHYNKAMVKRGLVNEWLGPR